MNRVVVILAAVLAALMMASNSYGRRLYSPGPVKAWMCIHKYEGSWTDAWDPYWGGLQMDQGFMNTYGLDYIHKRHGFANVWTPLEQMIVANRARVGVDWRGSTWPGPRGFSPWPNTARMCGLI